MIDDELLQRLCAAYAIADGYHDLAGRYQPATRETKVAILQSFSVPVTDEKAARRCLHDREDAAARPLPQTLVVRQSEGLVPSLRLGEKAGTNPVEWLLVLENGKQLEGVSAGDGALSFDDPLPLGYHQITLWPDTAEALRSTLIIAPIKAFGTAADRRIWGLTLPLYGLRSERNWGIGDFEDLAALSVLAGAQGADFVGINPVHALFPKAPGFYSPYSPSSREFLNVMHIAPDKIFELVSTNRGMAALKTLLSSPSFEKARASEFVSYDLVYRLKMQAFETAFEIFGTQPAEHRRQAAFAQFLENKGDALQRHALYEAIAERHGRNQTPLYDWQKWDCAYHDPDSAACRSFAHQHKDRVRFYAYLQWVADEQLARAQQKSVDAGMAVGLYLDLAVGMVPGGAEAWASQDKIATGMSLGAPGDAANPLGQVWQLSPLDPQAQEQSGYALFRQTLGSIMQRAGMVRIDHILGANRSFWCPLDGTAPGGYMGYALNDLLGIIALEAERAQCRVVGEDLGVVPEGFRDTLRDYGLYGCALFLFERHPDGSFKRAGDYCETRLASLSNHDFPTIRGFFEGRDLEWQRELGASAENGEQERQERNRSIAFIRQLLDQEGLLPVDAEPSPHLLNLALHRFIASTDAAIIGVQLEDLLGQSVQANVPGTTSEQPNWRRKLAVPINEIFSDGKTASIIDAINAARRQESPPIRSLQS